ncbi:MAG: substrate-binding domain-containing protein [Eubacterium sp.]|nr:substrate-binding domain-containing protein [Eubacterium sp.]
MKNHLIKGLMILSLAALTAGCGPDNKDNHNGASSAVSEASSSASGAAASGVSSSAVSSSTGEGTSEKENDQNSGKAREGDAASGKSETGGKETSSDKSSASKEDNDTNEEAGLNTNDNSNEEASVGEDRQSGEGQDFQTSDSGEDRTADHSEDSELLVINPEDYLTGTQFENLAADGTYQFQLIVKSMQSTYWDAVAAGAAAAAEDLGLPEDAVQVTGPKTESDRTGQINMFREAIDSKLSGIGIAASDAASMTEVLTEAKQAAIPVVCFDTGVEGAPDGAVTATIETDSFEAGTIAGNTLWKAVQERVSAIEDNQVAVVGLIAQEADALNHQQRGLGFLESFCAAARDAGISFAVTGNQFFVDNCKDTGDDPSDARLIIDCHVPAKSQPDLCVAEAQSLLYNEHCVGMFTTGQTAAEGAIQASGRRQILGSDPEKNCILIGFDSGRMVQAGVEDGTVYGAITQMPYAIGYYTVCALVQAANGNEVEDMQIPGYFYNATNIEDELILPNLYE